MNVEAFLSKLNCFLLMAASKTYAITESYLRGTLVITHILSINDSASNFNQKSKKQSIMVLCKNYMLMVQVTVSHRCYKFLSQYYCFYGPNEATNSCYFNYFQNISFPH